MSRCQHGPADVALVELVQQAKARDWKGPEAERFVKDVLPDLARPLVPQFPDLEEHEIHNVTWEIANKPAVVTKGCPQAWIRKRTWYKLLDAVRDQRKDARVRARLASDDREALISPAADAFIGDTPVQEVRAWECLHGLLLQLRWPDDVAYRAVEVLRQRAELADGTISIDATAEELDFVPRGLKRPLARFAFEKNGYVWALLKGIDPVMALKLDTVQSDLINIVWRPEPDAKRTRQAGSQGA